MVTTVGILLQSSFAATNSVSVETENATLSAGGKAALVSDVGASGGSAIQFGAAELPVDTGTCEVPTAQQLQDLDRDASEINTWPKVANEKVAVYFETSQIDAEFTGYMEQGAELWNESPCVSLRVVPSCPAGANCVTATMSDEISGNTVGRCTLSRSSSTGSITNGTIIIFSERLANSSSNGKLVTTTHEMGHCIGLMAHRLTERVLMSPTSYNDTPATPDAIDFQNLLVLYGEKI